MPSEQALISCARIHQLASLAASSLTTLLIDFALAATNKKLQTGWNVGQLLTDHIITARFHSKFINILVNQTNTLKK